RGRRQPCPPTCSGDWAIEPAQFRLWECDAPVEPQHRVKPQLAARLGRSLALPDLLILNEAFALPPAPPRWGVVQMGFAGDRCTRYHPTMAAPGEARTAQAARESDTC